jgi:hypothetical protein
MAGFAIVAFQILRNGIIGMWEVGRFGSLFTSGHITKGLKQCRANTRDCDRRNQAGPSEKTENERNE